MRRTEVLQEIRKLMRYKTGQVQKPVTVPIVVAPDQIRAVRAWPFLIRRRMASER
jgi:hypothetical protein